MLREEPGTPPGLPIITTRGITRRFGDLVAVNDVSISVIEGEVFGLLGPNGAGKSTTIKMLITLLPPSAGRAEVCGFDIARQAASVRRNIGYVPQMISTDGSLTGFENLLVFAKLYDLPRRELRQRVNASLEFMGLSDVANHLVRTYSGGMIRRLEIAQSLLHRPRVLFLDEPTVGLDPAARRAVWEHVQRLRADYGTTNFLTTHLMEEAEALCGRVAIMYRGAIAALGAPRELKVGIGRPEATLDDVFIYYAGDTLSSGGTYRETRRIRRTSRRLG